MQQDEPKLEIIDSVENEINLEEELASPQSMMTLPQAEKMSLDFPSQVLQPTCFWKFKSGGDPV